MKYFYPYGLSWKCIWNVFSISNIYINLSNASVILIDISKFKIYFNHYYLCNIFKSTYIFKVKLCKCVLNLNLK